MVSAQMDSLLLGMHPYSPVLVLILVIVGTALLILALTHVIGPSRRGPVKDDTYESGMTPIGDARRRFHVRFYIVAMLFLLFDVEVVFLWPWAPIFRDAAVEGAALTAGNQVFGPGFLLLEMAIFLAILLVGYIYAWRKGVFEWT